MGVFGSLLVPARPRETGQLEPGSGETRSELISRGPG
jgi:hypothetical protein